MTINGGAKKNLKETKTSFSSSKPSCQFDHHQTELDEPSVMGKIIKISFSEFFYRVISLFFGFSLIFGTAFFLAISSVFERIEFISFL